MTRSTSAVWRNILFDFDGTLVDSSPLHAEAYRRALERHRSDLIDAFDYDALRAKTTRDGFRSIGVDDGETLDRLVADKRRFLMEAIQDGRLAAFPGAHELLAALPATGRRAFLVTSGSKASVSAALRVCALTTLFEGIVTAEDVERGKPSPDGFLLCLRRFGLAAAASVVVEDAASGVAAARAAGLPVIAVHDAALIGQADVYFGDLTSLREWLATPVHEAAGAR